MTIALSLRPGDRVPDFVLPGLDGKLRKFIWSFTGKPVALVVADDLKTIDAEQFAAFAARCHRGQGRHRRRGGTPAAAAVPVWAKLGGDADGRLLLADGERKFVRLLLAQGGGVSFGQSGLGLRLRVIVLDANQRVAGTLRQPAAARGGREPRRPREQRAQRRRRRPGYPDAGGARAGAAAGVRARVLHPGDPPLGEGRPQGLRRLEPLRQCRHARSQAHRGLP